MPDFYGKLTEVLETQVSQQQIAESKKLQRLAQD